MCIFTHSGSRRFWAALLGLGTFAAASTPAAPDLPTLPNHISETTGQDPLFRIRSVTVNNLALSAISNELVNFPPHPDNVTFTYAPNPQVANPPLRFRCQLDGYESEWHERSALMRMMIHFSDAGQRDIAEQVFEVRGESPGWNGSFTNSPWVRRKEVVNIPANVERFWVVISSAGPPEAVGAFAIRNLVVFPNEGETNGIRLIPPVKFDAAKAATEAMEVSPAGWGRAGIRPADARLVRFGSSSDVALAILDDHPHGHAD